MLTKPIYGPADRTISHNGFVSEYTNGDAYAYEDYFVQSAFPWYKGNAPKERPVVFVVNQSTYFPSLFLAMAKAGKASILQQKDIGDITGTFLNYYITDSVLIKIRTGDKINPDGTKGFIADGFYDVTDSDSLILAKSKTVQKRGYEIPVPVIDTFLNFPTYYYPDQKNYPSIGYRALAAAKIYTIIDHFDYDKRLIDSIGMRCTANICPFS